MCYLHQNLRDLRFQFGFVVERPDHEFGDLNDTHVDICLRSDVHLRGGGLEVPRQSGKTV
jgi:hypothetical protein